MAIEPCLDDAGKISGQCSAEIAHLARGLCFQRRHRSFSDVAAAAGLKLFSMAGGIVVDDFENNGLLDVVTSSYDVCESMHYFHNNGDGTFTDRTDQAGLAGQLGGLNMIQADYNNDGCMDILVLRGQGNSP